jgi:alkylated DNA repair dioxygenase AlkB
MQLFDNDPYPNLLPYDGEARYYGRIFSVEKAQELYAHLLETTAWKRDEAIVFGKLIQTKRKVAWYGDGDYDYTYSGVTRRALPWTPVLRALKARAEEQTAASYNSCLINLYHSGEEGVSWHSDGEKTLGLEPTIASLSFGATRKFAFKHKRTKLSGSVMLEPGSLFVMAGTMQQHWVHSIPKTKKVKHPRINLTFRNIAQ